MLGKLALIFACLLALAPGAFAQPPAATKPEVSKPVVIKVDPPNWWTRQRINPLRLLVRGSGLTGASIAAPRGLRTSNVTVNAAGTYLFVDVDIAQKLKPGDYPLAVTTPNGTAVIPFRIDAPLPRKTNFQGFSSEDVIYLLLPGHFADGDASNDDPAVAHGLFDRTKPRYYHGGDLQGVIDHLPYLKDLGVTAIWLTPICDNSNVLDETEKRDGHAAVDDYTVEEHFGTLDLLRKLVEEAHRDGIKVIQGQEANHVSPYHPWVHDSPTPTWFHGTEANHPAETGQLAILADPHATPSSRENVTGGWLFNTLPDMNQADPEVARYEIQNALWWLGTVGFDGIGQHSLPYVPRTFWRDWTQAIRSEYPDVRVAGVVPSADPALTSFFQGGRVQYDGVDDLVDSVFDFPACDQIREAFAQGESLRGLADILGRDSLYPDPNRLITFIGTQDMRRFMSEPGATTDSLKLAFTFLLTARGIPMIYSGDEIGMPGGETPDNRRDFPGGWPGDAHNAFTAAGRSPEQEDVFEYVRKLLHLRTSLECLRRGRTLPLAATDRTLAYARVIKSQTAVVVINNGVAPATVKISLSDLNMPSLASWTPLLGTGSAPAISDGVVRVTLPPHTAEVYQVQGL